MKKNLAKRIVLGLLTGAVLMSSSVAWAAYVNMDSNTYSVYTFTDGSTTIGTSFGVGYSVVNDNDGMDPGNLQGNYGNSIVIGINSKINGEKSVALGNDATVNGSNSVALGYGSIASDPNVVSVGNGGATGGVGTDYRKIVNVANGNIDSADSHEAVTGGQLYTTITDIKKKIGGDDFSNLAQDSDVNSLFTNDKIVKNATTLVGAIKTLDNQVYLNRVEIANKADANDVYSKTEANNKFLTEEQANGLYVQIGKNDATGENQPQISIDANGQMVFGDTSSWIDGDGKGFYAGTVNDALGHVDGNERAAIKETGEIVGAAGQFRVNGTTGNVTAQEVTATKFYISDGNNKIAIEDKFADKTETATALAQKANQSDLEAEKTAREQADISLQQQITELGGGNSEAISGINQRLDKTNAKINKVGAGAAALAALHPLDYDPDDKLTFSAGMGNYAGENAAALGAFYRPNEKFMLSLGGTMGNGENMVNLGISIGLDKANGFAKMSKRELIQEVNAVKAENEVIKADNEAMKAEMAEMKAMLQELLAKK